MKSCSHRAFSSVFPLNLKLTCFHQNIVIPQVYHGLDQHIPKDVREKLIRILLLPASLEFGDQTEIGKDVVLCAGKDGGFEKFLEFAVIKDVKRLKVRGQEVIFKEGGMFGMILNIITSRIFN